MAYTAIQLRTRERLKDETAAYPGYLAELVSEAAQITALANKNGRTLEEQILLEELLTWFVADRDDIMEHFPTRVLLP